MTEVLKPANKKKKKLHYQIKINCYLLSINQIYFFYNYWNVLYIYLKYLIGNYLKNILHLYKETPGQLPADDVIKSHT